MYDSRKDTISYNELMHYESDPLEILKSVMYAIKGDKTDVAQLRISSPPSIVVRTLNGTPRPRRTLISPHATYIYRKDLGYVNTLSMSM
jgi:hypothetical protein